MDARRCCGGLQSGASSTRGSCGSWELPTETGGVTSQLRLGACCDACGSASGDGGEVCACAAALGGSSGAQVWGKAVDGCGACCIVRCPGDEDDGAVGGSWISCGAEQMPSDPVAASESAMVCSGAAAWTVPVAARNRPRKCPCALWASSRTWRRERCRTDPRSMPTSGRRGWRPQWSRSIGRRRCLHVGCTSLDACSAPSWGGGCWEGAVHEGAWVCRGLISLLRGCSSRAVRTTQRRVRCCVNVR